MQAKNTALEKIENGFGDTAMSGGACTSTPLNAACGGGGVSMREQDNLLDLVEEISRLQLGMVPFIMMLLLVLFSSQGCNNTVHSNQVDNLQNKYLSMMYR